MCAHAPQCAHGCQKTTCGSQFSPAMEALESGLRLCGMATNNVYLLSHLHSPSSFIVSPSFANPELNTEKVTSHSWYQMTYPYKSSPFFSLILASEVRLLLPTSFILAHFYIYEPQREAGGELGPCAAPISK